MGYRQSRTSADTKGIVCCERGMKWLKGKTADSGLMCCRVDRGMHACLRVDRWISGQCELEVELAGEIGWRCCLSVNPPRLQLFYSCFVLCCKTKVRFLPISITHAAKLAAGVIQGQSYLVVMKVEYCIVENSKTWSKPLPNNMTKFWHFKAVLFIYFLDIVP